MKMYRNRKAIARLLSLAFIPTFIAFMWGMSHNDIPNIWWMIVMGVSFPVEVWGLYYSEIFFTFRKEND